MPFTVNGVGTIYFGKKNLQQRSGVCRFCHRQVILKSYDTRLWISVFFIPIVPLKRKRIDDDCSLCRRHFVADSHAFEMAQQLAVSDALDQFRREPSVDSALFVHGNLLGFHKRDQAAEFREQAREQFPDEPILLAGFGAHLEQDASYNEAAACYEAALAQDASLPEARVGTARVRINENNLDAARALLSFLEESGAGLVYSLEPLETLALRLQAAGRHDEALELAGHLLRELPPIGDIHTFRAWVRKSERAARRQASLLPSTRHSVRALFSSKNSPYSPWVRRTAIAALFAGVLIPGLILHNLYIRGHRTLYVVNATGVPAQVQVDDEQPVEINGMGQVTVGEGQHRVHVSGPLEEVHEIDLSASFLDRWVKSPVWVYNVGGAALLREWTVHYSVQPRPSTSISFVGRPFVARAHVDYCFEEPPKTLTTEAKSISKTVFEWTPLSPVDTFRTILAENREQALNFAEHNLRREPGQRELFDAYLGAAAKTDTDRVRKFVQPMLTVRPVLIDWHRAHQAVEELAGHQAELVAEYDGLVQAEPRSGTLLYLRGRIEPKLDAAAALFKRSAEADPALSWPWYALAYRSASCGAWDAAYKELEEARQRGFDANRLAELRHTVLLGLYRYDALVDDYRQRLNSDPLDAGVVVRLCETLVIAEREAEAEQAVANWENQLPAESREIGSAFMRSMLAYLRGDMAGSVRLSVNKPELAAMRADALLAAGQSRLVLKDPDAMKAIEGVPWSMVTLSVALNKDLMLKEAAEWRAKACAALAKSSADDRRAAALLSGQVEATSDSLSEIALEPETMALLCVALAANRPPGAGILIDFAKMRSVRRMPPAGVVRRIIWHLPRRD